jgi:hypothetical protein
VGAGLGDEDGTEVGLPPHHSCDSPLVSFWQQRPQWRANSGAGARVVGRYLGLGDAVGSSVGSLDGLHIASLTLHTVAAHPRLLAGRPACPGDGPLGCAAHLGVGTGVGAEEGAGVGEAVGESDGLDEGSGVGAGVGGGVGDNVGEAVGEGVGVTVGASVGRILEMSITTTESSVRTLPAAHEERSPVAPNVGSVDDNTTDPPSTSGVGTSANASDAASGESAAAAAILERMRSIFRSFTDPASVMYSTTGVRSTVGAGVLGVDVGEAVGMRVGADEGGRVSSVADRRVGAIVGISVGARVGASVGAAVVGDVVGATVEGSAVGRSVGVGVMRNTGGNVKGARVGALDGGSELIAADAEGSSVGSSVGTADGAKLGARLEGAAVLQCAPRACWTARLSGSYASA